MTADTQSIRGFTDLSDGQKTWSRIRHELVYLFHALFELSLIVPIGLAVFSAFTWTATGTLLRLLVILLAPLYLVRLFAFLEMPLDLRRRVILGIGLLVMVLSVSVLNGRGLLWFGWLPRLFISMSETGNTEWQQYFGTLFLVGITWWRGTALVILDPSVNTVGRQLQWGGLLGIPLMILLVLRLDAVAWSPVGFVFLFFVIGMIEITLVRVEQAEREQQEAIVSATPMWLTRVGVLSVSLVTFAWGFGVFVGGETARGVARLFSPLWLALQFFTTTIVAVLGVVFAPLILFVEWLYWGLVNFWNRQFILLFERTENTEPSAEIEPPTEEDVEAPQWLIDVGQTVDWQLLVFIIVIALIVAFVVFVIWRGRVQARAGGNGRFLRTRNVVTTGKIESPEGLGSQIWRKLTEQERIAAAQSVKQIYTHLVAYGTECGYPRDTSITAYEHINNLRLIWPAQLAEIRLITRAYVKIRYGAYPETHEELNAIVHAWQAIQQAMPQVREDVED